QYAGSGSDCPRKLKPLLLLDRKAIRQCVFPRSHSDHREDPISFLQSEPWGMDVSPTVEDCDRKILSRRHVGEWLGYLVSLGQAISDDPVRPEIVDPLAV